MSITGVTVSPMTIQEETELYKTAENYGITQRDSNFWRSRNSNFLIRIVRFIILSGLVKIIAKEEWQKSF